MGIIETLKEEIHNVGVKEVSRRTGLSASTVSRVASGRIVPGFDVVEKISKAVGLKLDLIPDRKKDRLHETLKILRQLKPYLIKQGVKHVTVFGSVARGEDRHDSDLDLFVDFGDKSPDTQKMLKAEGEILEAFPSAKVDIVTSLKTEKGRRLKIEIDKDGHRAF